MATFSSDNSQRIVELSNAVIRLQGVVIALVVVSLTLTAAVAHLYLK